MRTNTFIAFKQEAFQFVLLVLILKSLRSTSLFHLQVIISKIFCIISQNVHYFSRRSVLAVQYLSPVHMHITQH